MPEETKNPMQELMDRKIWFLWIWSKDKNGNPTKKPIAANGGATGTDDAHSGTWVTYDEAVTAMHERGSAGVGFKIPKGYKNKNIFHIKRQPDLVDFNMNLCIVVMVFR